RYPDPREPTWPGPRTATTWATRHGSTSTPPPAATPGRLAFAFQVPALDQRWDRFAVSTQRRCHVPRGEHQLDVLDRLPRQLGIRPRLDDPEPDFRPRRGLPAHRH